MKFVFFGTDDFSVMVLEELERAGFIPALVITTPDKPRGRGLQISSSPVKLWAEKNGVPVSFDPDASVGTPTSDSLSERRGYQLFVVASYGKIIPQRILDIPQYGALNVHPSLLPRYRGPSPIESQILADEKEVGVSVMQVTEKMDAGPIVAQQRLEIRNPKSPPANRRAGEILKGSELRKELAEMGGKLLAETIPKWVSGDIKAVPQDESRASYTKKFTKADGEINLADDPRKNFLKIRAFEGSIGTYFFIGKTRIKITNASFENNTLRILRVTPEGKKEMNYEDFLRGIK